MSGPVVWARPHRLHAQRCEWPGCGPKVRFPAADDSNFLPAEGMFLRRLRFVTALCETHDRNFTPKRLGEAMLLCGMLQVTP